MSLDRVLGEMKDGERQTPGPYVPLNVWLDDLQAERDVLIMRLRHVDRVLVEYGRLKSETIPRRIR